MLRVKVAADLPDLHDSETIRRAGEIIRRGGLVAFPTETVYGLGANACDEQAVARIYSVKGRPGDNPLIRHVSGISDVERFAAVTETARLLAEKFWPGPLTMVMTRKCPIKTSEGFATCAPGTQTAPPSPVLLDTSACASIAVRAPTHPVAQALIKASGCIIAAPSANISGRPSPTTAEHVADDLTGKIDMLIDAGETTCGVESTVIDLRTEGTVCLLRPGSITPEMLESALGRKIILQTEVKTGEAPPSPGMKYRHYAPKAPLYLFTGEERIRQMAEQARTEHNIAGVMLTTEGRTEFLQLCGCDNLEILSLGSRSAPSEAAKRLYAYLRHFDKLGVAAILAEGMDETGLGLAVMNRLRKAAEN